jgi:competence protein ComEA
LGRERDGKQFAHLPNQDSSSIEDLPNVPGMARTWAVRIIRFRPYRTKLELLERGVLPSDVYNRIKDNVIAHHAKQ